MKTAKKKFVSSGTLFYNIVSTIFIYCFLFISLGSNPCELVSQFNGGETRLCTPPVKEIKAEVIDKEDK